MTVEFIANGALTNPKILLIATGEYIKINKSMVSGEIVVVTTEFGNRTAVSIINGVTTKIFNQVDYQSTWLNLNVGDNVFNYSADTNLVNLDCNILFQQKYNGV